MTIDMNVCIRGTTVLVCGRPAVLVQCVPLFYGSSMAANGLPKPGACNWLIEGLQLLTHAGVCYTNKINSTCMTLS